jgi:hypothetical protein
MNTGAVLLHTWNDDFDAPKMLTDIVPVIECCFSRYSGGIDRSTCQKLAENPFVPGMVRQLFKYHRLVRDT